MEIDGHKFNFIKAEYRYPDRYVCIFERDMDNGSEGKDIEILYGGGEERTKLNGGYLAAKAMRNLMLSLDSSLSHQSFILNNLDKDTWEDIIGIGDIGYRGSLMLYLNEEKMLKLKKDVEAKISILNKRITEPDLPESKEQFDEMRQQSLPYTSSDHKVFYSFCTAETKTPHTQVQEDVEDKYLIDVLLRKRDLLFRKKVADHMSGVTLAAAIAEEKDEFVRKCTTGIRVHAFKDNRWRQGLTAFNTFRNQMENPFIDGYLLKGRFNEYELTHVTLEPPSPTSGHRNVPEQLKDTMRKRQPLNTPILGHEGAVKLIFQDLDQRWVIDLMNQDDIRALNFMIDQIDDETEVTGGGKRRRTKRRRTKRRRTKRRKSNKTRKRKSRRTKKRRNRR